MPRYTVYGINVESETPLSLTPGNELGGSTVALTAADPAFFEAALSRAPLVDTPVDWFKIAYLPDGSIYVRWEAWFQFLISPLGDRVVHGLLAPSAEESLQTYLLSQALSYALVKMGHEPLHVTSVERDGAAIGFMGASGLGKSTLAAFFLAAGWRLLTDDVLIVSPKTRLAQPGPQRIKLLPEAANRFFGPVRFGATMNPASGKIVVPLDPELCCPHAVPLVRLYVLSNWGDAEDGSLPRSEQLSKQEAFVRLVGGTFNRWVRSHERLKRQFACFTRLAAMIPVDRLTYPRELSRIAEVHDLVLADLAKQ